MAKKIKATKNLKKRLIKTKPKVWFKKKIASFKKSPRFKLIRKQFFLYKLPLGLALIILIFIFSLILPKNSFQKAKEKLIKNPNNHEAHLVLAKTFLENNQIKAAEKELLWAQKIDPNNPHFKQLWQKKVEANPEDIQKLIKGWQKFLEKRPGYRDAYLQLAILSFKLGQKQEAQKYLEEALIIDPNYKPAKKLKKKLSF